jgi:hypothetical protein
MRSRKFAMLAAVVAGPLGTAAIAESAVAAEKTFSSSMSGRQEVPKTGDRNGRGTARITTDAARGKVCYRINLKRVGTVAAGHIHPGKRGVAGAPVVTLFGEATRKPRGCVRNVEKSLIRRIERNPGKFYVNVHNARFPEGAVRGQLKKGASS